MSYRIAKPRVESITDGNYYQSESEVLWKMIGLGEVRENSERVSTSLLFNE